jgi:hypothetical protein
MFMHKPPLVPNVEPGSDTRNVEAMRLLDRSLICVVLDLDCIEHAIGVIDEMNVIESQEISFRESRCHAFYGIGERHHPISAPPHDGAEGVGLPRPSAVVPARTRPPHEPATAPRIARALYEGIGSRNT